MKLVANVILMAVGLAEKPSDPRTPGPAPPNSLDLLIRITGKPIEPAEVQPVELSQILFGLFCGKVARLTIEAHEGPTRYAAPQFPSSLDLESPDHKR